MATYSFKTASEALPSMAMVLLDHGHEHGSRNGRVMELLNPQIVLENPARREILTANRKANVFAQIAETMWVLAGRNDVEWLSAYLPRAMDYSDDGETWRGGYGPRLRMWRSGHQQHLQQGGSILFEKKRTIDQLEHVIDLLREDPLSRRAVISIYDPTVDSAPGKDIPCNDFLQFQSRLGELHLTVTVRSNDLMWGWSGINAFEWSTLQEIVASLLGIKVGTLTFNIGSLHLYQNHWERARTLLYQDRHANPIPFNPNRTIQQLDEVDYLLEQWFEWESLCREGQATLAGLQVTLREPMFRAWAQAIAYYWMRGDEWLTDLQGTALGQAIALTPASVLSEPVQRSSSAWVAPTTTPALNENVRAFYTFVSELHAKKDASYGDSWQKRGEKLSILANIARKVDRLGVGDEYDSAADTWIDLTVYLAKYLCWLHGLEATPGHVNLSLDDVLHTTQHVTIMPSDIPEEIIGITKIFDTYADGVDNISLDDKKAFVQTLLMRVAPTARDVWLREKPVSEERPLDNLLREANEGDDYRGSDVD